MVLVDPPERTFPFVTSACILQQVVELLCKKDWQNVQTPLALAITEGKLGMCEIVLRSVQDYLGYTKVWRQSECKI